MLYFDTLPKILTPDENGNYIALTNLMTRAKLIEDLQNNPMLFYKYSIQDGDTPEILADKYYEDSYRYWIILYSNQIMDPLWQWPLTYNEFIAYLNEKYKEEANTANVSPVIYTQQTVYQYQKIITTTDTATDKVTINTVSISQSDYNSLIETTQTYQIPNSSPCIISVTKNIEYLYDYENNLNESRREIKIMDSFYALQMEEALINVMTR